MAETICLSKKVRDFKRFLMKMQKLKTILYDKSIYSSHGVIEIISGVHAQTLSLYSITLSICCSKRKKKGKTCNKYFPFAGVKHLFSFASCFLCSLHWETFKKKINSIARISCSCSLTHTATTLFYVFPL